MKKIEQPDPDDDLKEVYSEEDRESLVEDDEIEPWEQGFMEGAENDGQGAKCRKCGKVFLGPESVVEREINRTIARFCSEKCAEKFEIDRKSKK